MLLRLVGGDGADTPQAEDVAARPRQTRQLGGRWGMG